MTENPPAFPRNASEAEALQGGMTLRDYFAVHADQPGVSEIVSTAGYTTDGYWVYLPDGRVKFNDWWNGLPMASRYALSAKVRFAMADAMLTERTKENNHG